MGRILIVLSFLQMNLVSQPVFFVSEELEKERARYYQLLNGVRGDQPNWGEWILFFLKACDYMADRLHSKLEKAEDLARKGLKKCQTNSEETIWLYTFSNPFPTAKEAAEKGGVTQNTARKALNSLTEKGLLHRDTEKRRNVKYYNYDLARILSD